MRIMPAWGRELSSRAILSLSPQQWDSVFASVGRFLPPRYRQRLPGYKLHKFAGAITSEDVLAMYGKLTAYWDNSQRIVLGSDRILVPGFAQPRHLRGTEVLDNLLYSDSISYLPDGQLVRVDRASMGVSLETRLPMLDHRFVETAWRVPLQFKAKGTEGKWVLKHLLYRYVPRPIVDRPKTGFSVPIGTWLRGPLRAWAQHLSERRDWSQRLWAVLTFQSWHENNGN